MTTTPNRGLAPPITVTTGRLFSRLTRAGRLDDVEFLKGIVAARNAVANDNLPPPDGMGADSIMVMRPTEEEIRRASIKTKDGKPDPTGEIGLRFDARRRLAEWRVADKDGVPTFNKDGEEIWLKPVERYRQSKGGKRKTSKDLSVDEAAHAHWLISLRRLDTFPQPWVPDTRYASFGKTFGRIVAAYDGVVAEGVWSENRQLLEWLGVDCRRTLEQAAEANPQAGVMRGKTVVAHGAEFLSGKTDKNDKASEGSFVGAPDAAENSMVASIDANVTATKMVDVLEMAIAGMTAREIAAVKGHNDNKGGEKWAIRAIDRAIDDLKKFAA